MHLRTAFPLALLALLGCGRASQDASRVLANVGGSKITEQDLAATVKMLSSNPAEAEAVLKDPARREERQAILGQLTQTRAILELGRQEGLDQDPRVQTRMEGARAQVYLKTLAERRLTQQDAPEAELKSMYEGYSAQAKAAGQTMPPYPEALPRLKEIWSQQQQQRVMADFQKEVASKVHVTFAEEGGLR